MRVAAIVAVIALTVAACGGDGDDDSRVIGSLTDVRVAADGALEGISLRTEDGDLRDFAVELDPDAPVTADHLRLHIQQDWPVSVAFRDSRVGPVAYRIDDAGPPPGAD